LWCHVPFPVFSCDLQLIDQQVVFFQRDVTIDSGCAGPLFSTPGDSKPIFSVEQTPNCLRHIFLWFSFPTPKPPLRDLSECLFSHRKSFLVSPFPLLIDHMPQKRFFFSNGQSYLLNSCVSDEDGNLFRPQTPDGIPFSLPLSCGHSNRGPLGFGGCASFPFFPSEFTTHLFLSF